MRETGGLSLATLAVNRLGLCRATSETQDSALVSEIFFFFFADSALGKFAPFCRFNALNINPRLATERQSRQRTTHLLDPEGSR